MEAMQAGEPRAPGPVVVGVDDQPQSRAAARVGRWLAGALNRRLLLVAVAEVEGWMRRGGGQRYVAELRRRAETTLSGVRAEVDGETTVVDASSAARALHDVAERENASLVVVGGSHREGIARTLLPGGTGERLLFGAAWPVVIAPAEPAAGDAPVAVAYDATGEADAALDLGIAVARGSRRPLRIWHVAGSAGPRDDPDYADFRRFIHGIAQRILKDALARVPDDVEVATEVMEGNVVREIVSRAEADPVALLIAGSRSYGPLRLTLPGRTSARLMAHAPCPVAIVPRPAAS